MKISYNWLKEFVDVPEAPQELRNRFTNVGLAVDALESRADDSVFELDVATQSSRLPEPFRRRARSRGSLRHLPLKPPKFEFEKMTNARTTCSQSRLRIPTFAPVTADDTSRA